MPRDSGAEACAASPMSTTRRLLRRVATLSNRAMSWASGAMVNLRSAFALPVLVNPASNDQSRRDLQSQHSSVRPTIGRRAGLQRSVVIDMPGLETLWGMLGLFVVVVLLRIPTTRRVLVRLARRAGDRLISHWKRAEESDRDEDELWLMERRRRLVADLRRVEHLLATDTWMSATRQRGNRIAYNRLVDDLRHTPDVFSTSFQLQVVGPWDDPTIDPRWRGWLTMATFTQRADRRSARDRLGSSPNPAESPHGGRARWRRVRDFRWATGCAYRWRTGWSERRH